MAKRRHARETPPSRSSQRRSRQRKSHHDEADRSISRDRSRARSPLPSDQHGQLASLWRRIYSSMEYAAHKPPRYRSRSKSRTPEYRASSPLPSLSRSQSPPRRFVPSGYEPHSSPYRPVWSCVHSPETSTQAPRLTHSPHNLLTLPAQQYSPACAQSPNSPVYNPVLYTPTTPLWCSPGNSPVYCPAPAEPHSPAQQYAPVCAHSPNSPVYSPVLYTPSTPPWCSPGNSPVHGPTSAEPHSPAPYSPRSIQYSPQKAVEHSPYSPGSPQLTPHYYSPSSPYPSSPHSSPPTLPTYQHSPSSAPFSPDFSPFTTRSPSYSPPPPSPSTLRRESSLCLPAPLLYHSGTEVSCRSPVRRSSDPYMSASLPQSLLEVLSAIKKVAGGEASASRQHAEDTTLAEEEEEVEDDNNNENDHEEEEDEDKEEGASEQDEQSQEEDIGDEDSEEDEEDQEDEKEDAVLVKNEAEEDVEEDNNDEEEEQLEPEFEQQAQVKQEEQHVDDAPGTSQAVRASAEPEGPITEDMVREVLRLHRERIVALKSAREKWTAVVIYDEARRALRAEGLLVNQQKRIGEVPGIPVGMIFRTFMEMQCVGMKYMPRAGIDMMEYGGIKVSPIIVMVGQYKNLDQGETVHYMGQQVQDKDGLPLKDAPLSGGNQALVNSHALELPVRLIRRVQEGYMYSGLYRVTSWQYVQNGANQSIEFKLTRLPDQAPLPEGIVEYAGTRVQKRKRDKKPADAQRQKKPKGSHAGHMTPDMDAAAMDTVPAFSSPVTATAVGPSQGAGAASVAGSSQGRALHADTQRQSQQYSASGANIQSQQPSCNPAQPGQLDSRQTHTTSHVGSARPLYGETFAFTANRQSQPSKSKQPVVSSTPLKSQRQTDTQPDRHPPIQPHASMSVPRARPADTLKAAQARAQTDPVPERVSSKVQQVGASVSCNLEARMRIVAVRETWICPSADCGSPGVVVELASETAMLNARLLCGKCGKRMMRACVELD